MNKELRVIISGGGTGGHIFPAISIANAIRAKHPDAKILFVGALGRMEMERVPKAGYEIKGLLYADLTENIGLKTSLYCSKYGKANAWPRKSSGISNLWLPSV